MFSAEYNSPSDEDGVESANINAEFNSYSGEEKYSPKLHDFFLKQDSVNTEQSELSLPDTFLESCKTGNIDEVANFLGRYFILSNIELRNRALQSACDGNHLNILRKLAEKFPDFYSASVSIGTTERIPLFLYACAKCNIEIVEFLAHCIEQYRGGKITNIKDKDRSNALQYACCGDQLDVVKYLIEKRHFYINYKDKWGQLPIYFACKRDPMNFDIVEYLLSKKCYIENIDQNGDSIMDFFIYHLEITPITASTIFYVTNQKKRYFYQRIIEICYACLLADVLGRKENYAYSFQCIMKSENLPLIALAMVKYLAVLKTPIAFLNAEMNGQEEIQEEEILSGVNPLQNQKKLKNMNKKPKKKKKHEISRWYTVFRTFLEHSPFQYLFLYYVIQIVYGLQIASKKTPTERSDLEDIARKFEIMIDEIFACNSLDSIKNVFALLLPIEYYKIIYAYQVKKGMKMLKPVQECKLDTMEKELTVVHLCFENAIISMFGKPQINNVISLIFYGPSRGRKGLQFTIPLPQMYAYSLYAYSFAFLYDSTPNFRRTAYYGDNYSDLILAQRAYFQKIRYTHILPSFPAIVMLTEFGSKAMLLYSIAYVTVYVYGAIYSVDFSRSVSASDISKYQLNELQLVLLCIADILFKIGQLTQQWKLTHEFTEWDVVDIICATLMMMWMFLRYVAVDRIPAARVTLSITAIPMSYGLLRYMSVYPAVGELVILIKAMGSAIFTFMVIYFFSILGFGITFYGLFYEMTNGYSSSGYTLITLLENTLATFDFAVFKTSNAAVNDLGMVLLVLFLILTAVILMNLLIAQMTSSYNAVKMKSKKQWSFNVANLVSQYIHHNEEQNILCIFPPPMNLIGLLFTPLHYFVLSNYHFSIANTFNHLACSYVVGTYIRLYHNIGHLYRMLTKQVPKLCAEKKWSFIQRVGFFAVYFLVCVVLILIEIPILPIYAIVNECYFVTNPSKFCPLDPSNETDNTTKPELKDNTTTAAKLGSASIDSFANQLPTSGYNASPTKIPAISTTSNISYYSEVSRKSAFPFIRSFSSSSALSAIMRGNVADSLHSSKAMSEVNGFKSPKISSEDSNPHEEGADSQAAAAAVGGGGQDMDSDDHATADDGEIYHAETDRHYLKPSMFDTGDDHDDHYDETLHLSNDQDIDLMDMMIRRIQSIPSASPTSMPSSLSHVQSTVMYLAYTDEYRVPYLSLGLEKLYEVAILIWKFCSCQCFQKKSHEEPVAVSSSVRIVSSSITNNTIPAPPSSPIIVRYPTQSIDNADSINAGASSTTPQPVNRGRLESIANGFFSRKFHSQSKKTLDFYDYCEVLHLYNEPTPATNAPTTTTSSSTATGPAKTSRPTVPLNAKSAPFSGNTVSMQQQAVTALQGQQKKKVVSDSEEESAEEMMMNILGEADLLSMEEESMETTKTAYMASSPKGLPVELLRSPSSSSSSAAAIAEFIPVMILSPTETPKQSERLRLFHKEDIDRILHPLKSYIRSLTTDEFLRLENNVSQEVLKAKVELQEQLHAQYTSLVNKLHIQRTLVSTIHPPMTTHSIPIGPSKLYPSGQHVTHTVQQMREQTHQQQQKQQQQQQQQVWMKPQQHHPGRDSFIPHRMPSISSDPYSSQESDGTNTNDETVEEREEDESEIVTLASLRHRKPTHKLFPDDQTLPLLNNRKDTNESLRMEAFERRLDKLELTISDMHGLLKQIVQNTNK